MSKKNSVTRREAVKMACLSAFSLPLLGAVSMAAADA